MASWRTVDEAAWFAADDLVPPAIALARATVNALRRRRSRHRPAPPVYLRLVVRPGDLLSATVAVQKTRAIVIRFKNVTTGKVFTRTLRMRRPDRSSAEWVAEAPTGCDVYGCSTQRLTNFGSVSFSHASANVKGHKGRISDPFWRATVIELHDDPADPSQAGANAIPGELGADGGSFAVTWQKLTPPPPPPSG